MNVNWSGHACRRRHRELTLLASGLLPEKERDRVQAHLAGCTHCRAYHDQLSRLTEGLHSLRQSSREVEPSAALRARWMRAVRTTPPPETFSGVAAAALALACGIAKRPAWAGLAGVWLLILFFRVTSPSVSEVANPGPLPPPRAIYLALRNPDWPPMEVADRSGDSRKKAPDPPPPKPRSEQPSTSKAA